MYISIFDLFKIGVGPSSSHTMGPMTASFNFINNILKNINVNDIDEIQIELFGSLAYTGKGHKTYEAILMGLHEILPENIDNNYMNKYIKSVIDNNEILLRDRKIKFNMNTNIIVNRTDNSHKLPNPIKFYCKTLDGRLLKSTYYSIGGGFISGDDCNVSTENNTIPHSFTCGNDLLNICKTKNINIYDVVLENEYKLSNKSIVDTKILNIWNNMNNIIKSGIYKSGKIDNILNVNRRANYLYNSLKRKNTYDPLEIMDWVNIFAISTCEENASGSKIVTAPTNGASGIIPAVLKYYQKFITASNDDGIIKFLATSSAIGMIFKLNASISGADMGCQGEVGVACSMAAAGLTASLGGTPEQIENAAEIGMEHNLGLTCDPVKGLVQIPCIERNSMGAIKAINASRLALNSSGKHKVSLDEVINTMYETGKSMNSIFKETSLGGLAVNVIEC